MVDEPDPRELTVRDLRAALCAADPDDIVRLAIDTLVGTDPAASDQRWRINIAVVPVGHPAAGTFRLRVDHPGSEVATLNDGVNVSSEERMRAATALTPFVGEYKLSLNPEELEEMAYAVLRYARSAQDLKEIDEAVRAQIADAQAATRRMREAQTKAMEDRSDSPC